MSTQAWPATLPEQLAAVATLLVNLLDGIHRTERAHQPGEGTLDLLELDAAATLDRGRSRSAAAMADCAACSMAVGESVGLIAKRPRLPG